MTSLYIIGMNNPQGRLPLDTQPRGGAGHRLWLMVTARTGVSEAKWLAGTTRVNLCDREWNPDEARLNFEEMSSEFRSDMQILYLGKDVVACTGTDDAPMCGRRDNSWFLPHPSGRNRWYNEHLHKDAASLLLRDFWNMRYT